MNIAATISNASEKQSATGKHSVNEVSTSVNLPAKVLANIEASELGLAEIQIAGLEIHRENNLDSTAV